MDRSSDGRAASEIGRRIGAAKAEFDTLRRVWAHAGISSKRKLRIFDACVMSRLSYGLSAVFLNKAALRRLDGFQAQCLRKLLGISHSYWSRIPNTEVLRRAESTKITWRIQQHQMILMGRIARGELGEQVRSYFFSEGTVQLQPLPGIRRVGRPRQTWMATVHDHCLKAAGCPLNLEQLLAAGEGASIRWRACVNRHIHT